MAYLPPKEKQVPTKAQIESQLRDAIAERDAARAHKDRAEKDLENFKKQVVLEVREAKEAHDLCDSGVNEFMDALELPRISEKFRIPVTITLQATIQVNSPDPEGDVDEMLKDGMVDLLDPEDVEKIFSEVFGDVTDFNESGENRGATIVDGTYVLNGQEKYYDGSHFGSSPRKNIQNFNVQFGKPVRLEDV